MIAKLITGGGRRVVVEDSDWRTMLAFAAFREKHGDDQGFPAWQKQTRPLTSLKSLADHPGPGPPGAGEGRVGSDLPAPGPVVDPPPGLGSRGPDGRLAGR